MKYRRGGKQISVFLNGFPNLFHHPHIKAQVMEGEKLEGQYFPGPEKVADICFGKFFTSIAVAGSVHRGKVSFKRLVPDAEAPLPG
jgi:hypothetical protein